MAAPNPPGATLLHELLHFPRDPEGRLEAWRGRSLGVYNSLAAAEAAVAARIGAPGFRETPDGFVVFPTALDHDRWPAGVGDLVTPDRQPAEGLPCRPGAGGTGAAPGVPAEAWALHHVPWEHGQDLAGNQGWKLIGFYRSEALALAALERARALPGFRLGPEDFRLHAFGLNHGGWRQGFPAKEATTMRASPAAPAPNSPNAPLLYNLFHYPRDAAGSFENIRWKDLGFYESLDEAEAAAARRVGFRGFRDTPDGFRVFPLALDHDRWPQGIAEIDSGDFLPEFGLPCRLGTNRPAGAPRGLAQVHALYHFPLPAWSEDDFMDEAVWKLVGLYSTEALALAARERARRLPGFRDWPGGFRLYPGTVNTGSWEDGFFDWTKEVWDDGV